MFRSARVKLTAWYLLIIMIISAAFSLVIYGGLTSELEGRFANMERRIQLERHFLGMRPAPPPYFMEDLQAAERRVLIILLSANGVILVLSAAAGYFLAGRTLGPIEAALDEQKRFVSDASHELRTPLTALKTSIEVALRDKKMTKKDAQEVLQSSLEEVDSLQALTLDLLTLAQHQEPNGNFAFERVNLKQLLERATKKVYPLAKEKSIDLDIDARDIVLEADEMSLEKTVVILLDNAIKYTPEKGKVSVTTSEDKRNAVLSVTDTGIGIAKEEIARIFDRFYRVDQSRSRTKVPGFGLGLPMAKKIIGLHKGSIHASSDLGKGTTFTVRIPLTQG